MKKFICLILIALLCAGNAYAACSAATIPTPAKIKFLNGSFGTSDTYKIAFFTSSATYGATSTGYGATNEVSGTGYSAGGYTLDSFAVTSASTTAYIDWADEVNNTVTFNSAAECVIIYNDTDAADQILYVSAITSVQPSAGTLTVTFPTADSSTAIIRLAKKVWNAIVPEAWAADIVDAQVVLEGASILGNGKEIVFGSPE
jgi:hypothetical protein